MSFQNKKRMCILLILCLLFLAMFPILFFGKKQPEGEYITKEEMIVLNDLLQTLIIDQSLNPSEVWEMQKETAAELQELTKGWKIKDYITYQHFQQWEETAAAAADVLEEDEKRQWEQKYRDSFYITKEDWFSYFKKVCRVFDTEEKIAVKELLILGDCEQVTDAEGTPMEETQVFTQDGCWETKWKSDFILQQQKASYITYEGSLWGVYNVCQDAVLSNVWLVENTEDELSYFYQNFKVKTVKDSVSAEAEEQVADLIFQQGKLQEIRTKKEKIHGKVLKISAEEVEIEGEGRYPLSEDIQYYRLYDRLENVGRNEVRLGYDFTDFVIEDGKIQAALLVKDEKMENIRVLLKNSGFQGYFHDKIEGWADVDIEIIYGKEKIEIPAGEIFSISADSEYFTENRIYIKPTALTGRTVLTSIERDHGGQGYYGSLELEKREEGILIINEVLLEEYLYAVVPSEMPGYYPLEALKAQAISARTYAYDKMIHCGLSSYGANLDDSAAYQVYNNIKENANTTAAVRETRGKLLYAENELAGTYYYSTSCGFGTDSSIWNEKNENTVSYLQAKEMTLASSVHTAEDMQIEEKFAEFITQKQDSHFESEENWYRWSYEHDHMEVVAEKLMHRLENYPNYVFTSKDGVNWGSEPLEEGFEITDIQVQSRGVGGTIAELLITTDRGYVLVKNEYHVRAVLTDGESKAVLQKDAVYACGNLLPSAFFIIEPKYENGKVCGIRLTGGGFGHGVGMSQNGAKNLAEQGFTANEILTFYYEGCQVKE